MFKLVNAFRDSKRGEKDWRHFGIEVSIANFLEEVNY